MISEVEHQKILEKVQKNAFAIRIDDLNALREVYGEQVEEIVKTNRAKKIKANWCQIAEAHGRNDIQGIKETLWTWVLDEGIEYEVEDLAEGTQFRVTRCPLAEMAQELDATDWGYVCFLCRRSTHSGGIQSKNGIQAHKDFDGRARLL